MAMKETESCIFADGVVCMCAHRQCRDVELLLSTIPPAKML